MSELPWDTASTVFLERPIGPSGTWMKNPRYGGTLRKCLSELAIMARPLLRTVDGRLRLQGRQLIGLIDGDAEATVQMRAARDEVIEAR